jgi:hypothetical protein
VQNIATSTWKRLSVVVNGTHVLWYLNGNLFGSVTTLGVTIPSFCTYNMVGGRPVSTGYLTAGSLKSLTVYSSALSGAQLGALPACTAKDAEDVDVPIEDVVDSSEKSDMLALEEPQEDLMHNENQIHHQQTQQQRQQQQQLQQLHLPTFAVIGACVSVFVVLLALFTRTRRRSSTATTPTQQHIATQATTMLVNTA